MKYLLLVLLFSTSCANADRIDTKLQPYYDDYISEVKNKCNISQWEHPYTLIIEFGDLSKDKWIGLTHRIYVINKSLFVRVTIDKAYWSRADQAQKVGLTYHEFTHAFFDYPDLRTDEYRNHFMFWKDNYVSQPEVTRQLRELLDQLCKKP